MRRFAWLLMLSAACTRSDSSEAEPTVRSYPALAPPTGAIGEPGDEPQEWSASGQWVAVCRGDADDAVPKLLVGDDHELDLDAVLVAGPLGRFVVISRDGERVLYDAVRRREWVMGTIGQTTQGSFDAEGRRFVYGRMIDGRDEVVVRFLDSDTERVVESPVHPLSGATLDSSGRHLWMTAWRYTDDDEDDGPEVDANMCVVRRGCDMGRMARHVGTAVLDLESPGAEFVRIDHRDAEPHAIDERLVLESEQAIELVTPEGRRKIAPGECGVEHAEPSNATVVVSCPDGSDSRDYFVWRDGELNPLDFEWAHSDWSFAPGHGPYPGTLVHGKGGRWLSLAGPHVIQGLASQTEGYAFEGRVLLVGTEAGVEIRDGASDTRAVHHELRASIDFAQGPYVALRTMSASGEGGWVIDLREGTSLRRYEAPALALARSGHVAVRDDDGRLRWR